MASHDGQHRHARATLLVLALDTGSYAFLQSVVTPALPEIQRSLGASTSAIAWVLTAYLLSAAVATPIIGRLGDMYGKQRVLGIVLAILVAGTVLAALSSSLAVLVVARAMQGVAGGVFPLAFGIVRDELPPGRVAGGIGQVSATLGVGSSAGIIASGVIVDNLSYHWLFWLPLVPLVAAFVLSSRVIPPSPVRTPGRIAWLAAALLCAGLAAILLAITQAPSWGWGSPRTIGLLAGGFVLLVAWVRAELRAREPLVDMRMMRVRAVWTANLAGLLLAVGMFAIFILVPQIALLPASTGVGFGVGPVQAGLFLLPAAVLMLIAGMVIGPLQQRFGPKPGLVLGAVMSMAAFVLLTVAHDQRWEIYLASALAGLGIGLSLAALPNLIVLAVRPEETGVATGMNTVTRWIGGALGTQVAATLIAASETGNGLPTDSGFTAAFAFTAATLAVATVASLLVPGGRASGLALAPVAAGERLGDRPSHALRVHAPPAVARGDAPDR